MIGKNKSKYLGIKKIFCFSENKFYEKLHICEKIAKKNNTYINIEYNKEISQSILEKLNKIL